MNSNLNTIIRPSFRIAHENHNLYVGRIPNFEYLFLFSWSEANLQGPRIIAIMLAIILDALMLAIILLLGKLYFWGRF